MRLLALTPNPSVAASTRYRLEQYFPALRAAGIEPLLRPFLDETGFSVLYQRGFLRRKAAVALRALGGRVADLLRSHDADAVLIHREAALVGPPLIEWAVARVVRRPIIFDLDDAVWVSYVSPTYGALLPNLFKMPQKTNFTVAAAVRVIAGNPHVAAYARRLNARTEIIPTVVDTEKFRPAPRDHRVPVLGWIGSHSSLQYLRSLVPALQRLACTHHFVVRVVGGTLDAPGVEVENLPWTLEREVSHFQSLDVGLYPLVEDDWSLGKSGFKAVQYMACGVPVVASPIGVTRDMIRDGETGFLAANEDAWVEHLGRLIDDAALRRRLGEAGRVEAVARWSLAAHAPRFVEVVLDAMRRQ
jgi:glycosyltransferase involved in cell wall biosynthesis